MVADGFVWKKFHTGFPMFWGNSSGRRTGHLWKLHREYLPRFYKFRLLQQFFTFSIVEFLVGSSPKKKIFLLVDYPRVVFILKSSSKTFHTSPNSCVLLLFWIEVIYLCFFFFSFLWLYAFNC